MGVNRHSVCRLLTAVTKPRTVTERGGSGGWLDRASATGVPISSDKIFFDGMHVYSSTWYTTGALLHRQGEPLTTGKSEGTCPKKGFPTNPKYIVEHITKEFSPVSSSRRLRYGTPVWKLRKQVIQQCIQFFFTRCVPTIMRMICRKIFLLQKIDR